MKMSASERIRLKELAKYYNVANVKARYLRHAPSAHDKYQQDIIDVDDLRTIKRNPAEDRQLTALAQLAVRKLAFQRCFISLIDDKCQHFIAEATPWTSLGPEGFKTQQDLMIGVQSILLDQKWLPTTCTTGHDHFELDPLAGQDILEGEGMYLFDLASHKASKQSNLLLAFPEAFRAYVEVPLLTGSGYVFGSLCVIDSVSHDAQRTDLHQLQEVADLIVDHLDTLRLKADFGRAQRLLQGLAHFIEGKESLSDWSNKTSGQDPIPAVNVGDHNLSAIRPRHESTKSKSNRSGSLSSASISLDNDASLSEGLLYVTPSTSEATESHTMLEPQVDPVTNEIVSPGLLKSMADDGSRQLGSTSMSVVAEAFSRASNLIRESMSLEATCFLEVPHNERAQLGNQRGRTKTQRIDEGSQPATDSSSDATTSEDMSQTQNDEVMCHRLAFSAKGRSSVARSYASAKYLTIPATTLKTLASRYPRGRIFHFDGGGSISSSDESAKEAVVPPAVVDGAGPHVRRRKISHQLSKFFPDARSLIFVPLYDSDRQHIFAGFLGWTANATRALQEHEVTFIKGFVDSVMCEVQRLESISTDKAKSDFIASISHELRTPLHGILASTQLLSQGDKFEQQSEFIDMIDTCGHTLLDVMDHLFDYAKINHFTQRGKSKKAMLQNDGSDAAKKTFSLVSHVNLANIVEETAASVAASSNQLSRQRRGIPPHSSDMDPTEIEKVSVPIVLEIAKAHRWDFHTESGSWRRIIMNLIGNSLKYTIQGHILVKLSLAQDETPGSSINDCIVTLRVGDTGQGISEEYLKHRLFTAFAQEDNLSVGTGLGLSLVNHIVTTLDGKIEVQSEIGQGTEILIKIPVKASETTPTKETLDVEATSALIGMNVAISGFAEAPASPTGVPGVHATALLALKQSLTNMVTDWFQMRVVSNDAMVHILERSYLEIHKDEYDTAQHKILIIGTEGLQKSSIEMRNARYICIAAPIGPVRLAKAIQSLLSIRDAASDALESVSAMEARDHLHGLANPMDTFHSSQSKAFQHAEQMAEAKADTHDFASIKTPRPTQRRTPSNRTVVAALSELQTFDETQPHQTVLLVDDNEINLRVLISFVRRLQTLDVLTASNGKEALDIFTSSFDSGKTISFVLMDINMPIMDGYEATSRMRQYENSHKNLGISAATIVALTGLGSEESQSRIESCGFDEYLRKPVSLKQLREIFNSRKSSV